MTAPLISLQMLDLLRSTVPQVLRDRTRVYFRARGRAPALFEDALPEIVDHFVTRLIATCDAHLARGDRAPAAVETRQSDAILAGVLLAHCATWPAEQRSAATAWELAINFLLLGSNTPKP